VDSFSVASCSVSKTLVSKVRRLQTCPLFLP
jgi:hypothetical protein